MPEAVMEVGALLGDHWTGIPAVVAGLAEAALHDPEIDWSFMIGTIAVPGPMMTALLDRRSGAVARNALATLAWEQGEIPRALADRAAGVFTNIKPLRGFFGREAMIVYDLSPLLTPRFHDEAGIAWFTDNIRADIAGSDHLFCISRATQADVTAYFGVPAGRMSLVTPGVRFDPVDLSAARHMPPCEPYVVIVGTLEPRKNGALVLAHLARDPGFAARYRIVFIGCDGWLDEKARLLAAAGGVAADRVVFAGFVDEREKLALMLNAAFCIYPSFFEGYGLPVLEAAVLGRLTVCSNTSSLPEVAPGASILFDPLDPDDFARALDEAERRAPTMPRPSLATLIDRAEEASATRTYPPIARWVAAR
ncbi:glycosyltransferase family 4 protein [Sphingomonas solaris]|uniref:Glycosyltransferase family 4 protein n=1 Tax=Alterirhizorhabdus solaris TaxID=2529389 RepID=A0A558QUK5_9SPHN|nr:glycosyltransferase family 1 protein [Sphingomonas solaris]TVV70742.1 glycosyltransferase family 4 protein [Sphingomonas solaris]